MRAYRFRVAFSLFALFAGLLCVPVAIRMIVARHLFVDPGAAPSAQIVMIPGASVVHGKPSDVLAERIATAIELYHAGHAGKILVSGDNGDRHYNEVTAILDRLLASGIPQRDIFLDRAGFDTYSSMYRARHIFGAQKVLIVTQDFHLPRAVFLARTLGLDADGVVAGRGGGVWDYAREIPASIKALLDLALRREP